MDRQTLLVLIIVGIISVLGIGLMYFSDADTGLARRLPQLPPTAQPCALDTSRICTQACTAAMRQDRDSCETTAPKSELLFREDFEAPLQGWDGRTDAFTITNQYAKTGTHAILNPDKYDTSISKTIGNYDTMTYSCWFYDLMGSTSETSCIVTTGAVASREMLLLGTETEKSKTHYTYFLSPDANSWGVSSVPRTLGWHNAKFAKHDGVTDLYIDNVKVASTANNNGWSKIAIALNNWYHAPGHDHAIFDNLEVTRPATPTTESKYTCMKQATEKMLACVDTCVGNERQTGLLVRR